MNWHDAQWRQLWAPAAGLPHALLLSGVEGIGKGAFALAVAARLLCDAPVGGVACADCPSCRWFAGGNHPDFRYVLPDGDSENDTEASESDKKKTNRRIVIDQIRALEEFVFMGGHRNGARIIVIDPAETMNLPAANALLKILEEPPASVYFVLVSSNKSRLLPTILSRCRVLKLPRPSSNDAVDWLRQQGDLRAADLLPLMGGAPLLALRESVQGKGSALGALLASLATPGRDSLALAAIWEGQLQAKNDSGLTMDNLVLAVQKWIFDLALLKLSGGRRFLVNRATATAELVRNAPAIGLIRCYNDLLKIRALASHPLNARLYLEDIAERYLRALAIDRQ